MRKLIRRQSDQSKKAEIVNYYYQWQNLKDQWKKKDKGELHSYCQNTKRDREESYFERYCTAGTDRLRSSVRSK
jgi:hypothetical protein